MDCGIPMRPLTSRPGERSAARKLATAATLLAALLLSACGQSNPVNSTEAAARATAAKGGECTAPAAGQPMLITEDCIDPRYGEPYLLADLGQLSVEQLPVPHYVVHGGFRGTPAKFAFYFPLRDQYQGRFFHGPIHQLRLTSEVASRDELAFAFDSGAYVIQVNPLQDGALTARDALSGRYDPSLMGYRLSAAAAKFSRQVAARVYGFEHRPYGYIFGGSGGSYMTVASAENTSGVWDGAVPFVFGHPLAIPNNYSARLHALRILRMRNKWPDVMDAIEPGGSGNPYATLNAEEAAALREATLLGFPLRGWYEHPTMTAGAFFLVAQYTPLLDPDYVNDFWTLPGYLGTDPSSSVVAARVQHPTTVVATTGPAPDPDYNALGPTYTAYMLSGYVTGPARRITLQSLPEGDLTNDFHLVIESGAGAGQSVKIGSVDRSTNTIGFGGGEDPAVVNLIAVGDKVRVDNSMFLALQTYHRHQVPADRDYYGWDQFRDARGNPLYPQRSSQVGPSGAFNAAGAVSTGRFNGKMIMLQSMMDIDAFPWCADWYRGRAAEAKQLRGQRLDDHFRLWFTDHAQHTTGSDAARTVGYGGVLQQALRDLAKWVEEGVPPPASTNYRIVDTQVVLPAKAHQRRGIQPVVELSANGRERADVAVNEPVQFTATVEVPPGTGEIVATEWDFEGAGEFAGQGDDLTPDPSSGQLPTLDANGGEEGIQLQATHRYAQPGTYFPVVRVTSQREGDPETPYGRVQNIARARVVVR